MAESMNVLSGTVTKVGSCLIITVSGDLDDRNIQEMNENILNRVGLWRIDGAVFDFSSVKIMDTYMFMSFRDCANALTLLGVKSVWTGLSPMVVASIMDMGHMDGLDHIDTAITLERGLEMLRGIEYEG